jgi:hypothetical protein
LFDELSEVNHRPRKPTCRRWPGCGALRAGRRRPAWRPCPLLTNCASRMATSGPPCGGALGSPTSPMELQPLLAFAVLSSARRTLSTPSPAVPPISCACCTMMKSWTLCAVRCGGGGLLRRRSPVSLCCICSRRACGHRQGRTETCCSLLRGSSAWVTSLSSTLGPPRTIARWRRRQTAARPHGGTQPRPPSIEGIYIYGVGCYRFVPLTVETFGRLGKPLMKLITDVSDQATQHGNGSFTREQFVTGVLRELSVCLCRHDASLERAVAGCFVRVSGGSYSPGLDQPTAEVG